MPYSLKTITLFVKPFIWLIIIIVLCFLPPEDIPKTPLVNIPNFDKVVHFGMYFIFAVLLARPLMTIRVKVWLTVLVISAFVGGLIEILQQTITSYRSASWGDFAADFAGAVAGVLIYKWLIAGKRWERYI